MGAVGGGSCKNPVRAEANTSILKFPLHFEIPERTVFYGHNFPVLAELKVP
jgi:hypothetical protein